MKGGRGMTKTKGLQVAVVVVRDPDTGNDVDVAIFKLEGGGMMGVDASFVEQEVGPVYSCFDKNVEVEIEL